MKRFRYITITTLVVIAIMVVANIVYLHSLYNSIKEQSIQTATECLRRADILEIISRMKGTSVGEDLRIHQSLGEHRQDHELVFSLHSIKHSGYESA